MGEFCYRFSAFPLPFNDALAECQADGSSLAYVPDRSAQTAIKDHIVLKKNRFDFFDNVGYFWLGGQPTTGWNWDWLSSTKPMPAYENWKTKIRGIRTKTKIIDLKKYIFQFSILPGF